MRAQGRSAGVWRPQDRGDLILTLHCSPGRASWSVVLRRRDGHSVFDRHVDSGVLDSCPAFPSPPEAAALLRAVLSEWEKSRRIPRAEPAREPGRAVGEQPRWVDVALPGL